MTDKSTKTSAKIVDMVQLIDENEVQSIMGEAFASFMLNPTVTWAKFILTDDGKNANGERIPKSEFQNLIVSGIHMPVKMAIGEISPGHPGTKPLGTITHLKEVATENGGTAIVALAALWGQERPADIEFIKQRFAEKKSVDVSWEVLYEDATFNPETESMDLFGTVLRAATIVGNPAYEGRTTFLSIAATKKSDATLQADLDKLAEDELKTIEELQAEVDAKDASIAEIQAKLDDATSKLAALAEKDAEIVRLTEENTAKDTELTSLKEFKASIDAENEKKTKLESVKAKFVEAGLDKTEEYFTENAEKLVSMSEDDLGFMLQELKAFAETHKDSSAASKKTTKIPAVLGDDNQEITIEDLADYLRSKGKK